MPKPLLLSFLAVSVLSASGCAYFRSSRPKSSNTAAVEITADVEASFQRRWMDKRVGELTAQGATPEAARLQADGEFRERFSYTKAAQKK